MPLCRISMAGCERSVVEWFGAVVEKNKMVRKLEGLVKKKVFFLPT